MMTTTKPATRPANPRFSSGPCAKPPAFSLDRLSDAALGRSHRAAVGKARLKAAIDGTREILGIPDDYRIGIVPASDTGAVEMAMWSLLGQRPVEMLAWESFGAGWVTDAVKQLKLDATVRQADYGRIVDFAEVDFARDVVFTWNGTTSGVRVPDSVSIPADRGGLTICDATSAAFAQRLPWDRLDVTTFSWQKVLGGEAAHGMLVLSPRAVERLESYTPPGRCPRSSGSPRAETDRRHLRRRNDQHAVHARGRGLPPRARLGPLGRRPRGLIARADANTAVIERFVADHGWIDFLAKTRPPGRTPPSA